MLFIPNISLYRKLYNCYDGNNSPIQDGEGAEVATHGIGCLTLCPWTLTGVESHPRPIKQQGVDFHSQKN